MSELGESLWCGSLVSSSHQSVDRRTHVSHPHVADRGDCNSSEHRRRHSVVLGQLGTGRLRVKRLGVDAGPSCRRSRSIDCNHPAPSHRSGIHTDPLRVPEVFAMLVVVAVHSVIVLNAAI